MACLAWLYYSVWKTEKVEAEDEDELAVLYPAGLCFLLDVVWESRWDSRNEAVLERHQGFLFILGSRSGAKSAMWHLKLDRRKPHDDKNSTSYAATTVPTLFPNICYVSDAHVGPFYWSTLRCLLIICPVELTISVKIKSPKRSTSFDTAYLISWITIG